MKPSGLSPEGAELFVYKQGLTQSQAVSVESAINRVLPKSYKDFLRRMNGLYFALPDYGEISLAMVAGGVISFDRFFGLSPDEQCNCLVCFNNQYIDELAFVGDVLAIGEDGGGNPYVLISTPGREGVYYWDRTHLHEPGLTRDVDIAEQNECGDLFFISPGFEEFYNTLFSSAGVDVEFVLGR
ncbi:SMI1/KNR4 family protein [Pseudomonas tussilaginis]|uniref:SMI1/KNR4 family protein n=1 Tax=Pseudomonas sp. 5 TaxID=1619949 RepID=UPI002109812B|nr:SMI1/KNR4 family protein [Pseudomonas sp. 5]